MAGGYVLTMFLLGLAGFRYDSRSISHSGTSWKAFRVWRAVVSDSLFHRGTKTESGIPNQPAPGKAGDSRAAGRLAGREGAVMVLSGWIYGIRFEVSELLARVHGGGDPTAPWFTPVYILGTLAGSLLLGILFGQKKTAVEVPRL